jgi:hypothetical protein
VTEKNQAQTQAGFLGLLFHDDVGVVAVLEAESLVSTII